VSEVCTLLDTKQPIISQQLSILRKSRVVVGRRDGNRVIYAMASARVTEIVRLLRNDASLTWEEPRTNGEYRQ
jgi:ArsR family transcriptional regulator